MRVDDHHPPTHRMNVLQDTKDVGGIEVIENPQEKNHVKLAVRRRLDLTHILLLETHAGQLQTLGGPGALAHSLVARVHGKHLRAA